MDEAVNDHYNISEVAEELQVHHTTVRKWIRQKKIKAVKIAYWRIPADELERIKQDGVE